MPPFRQVWPPAVPPEASLCRQLCRQLHSFAANCAATAMPPCRQTMPPCRHAAMPPQLCRHAATAMPPCRHAAKRRSYAAGGIFAANCAAKAAGGKDNFAPGRGGGDFVGPAFRLVTLNQILGMPSALPRIGEIWQRSDKIRNSRAKNLENLAKSSKILQNLTKACK